MVGGKTSSDPKEKIRDYLKCDYQVGPSSAAAAGNDSLAAGVSLCFRRYQTSATILLANFCTCVRWFLSATWLRFLFERAHLRDIARPLSFVFLL